MKQVDMSDKAVTARLKRVAQLRRLGLSLKNAKLHAEGNRVKVHDQQNESSQPSPKKAK